MLKDNSLFFLGDWQVNPSTNTLRRGELIKQLEPKAMDVLLLLCKQQGEVLSADEIATQCWGGMDIGDNPVHKAITQLRKALDDKPSTPTYIETIRKRGYHIIAKLDFPLDDELKAEQSNWEGASPFPGLVAFEAKDAQVFFGRNTQISSLLERLSNQVSAQHTFCLILGPSGTGKSSLVNAGLLPALTSSNGYNGIGVISHTSIDFADISHERLFVDLASAMLDWDVNDQPVFAGMSAENLAQQLQKDSNTSIEQCIQALKQTQQSYSKPRFLLFIDRLEVLLSSPVFSDDERVAFLGLIEILATSGAIIVISACRNDFYPLVVNHPSLMVNKGNGGHFDLLAPTRAELLQMIRLPAVAANLTWSVDADSATPLDQILCAEAANNPDALPMLQYTLQELYLQRSETDELQVSVYQSLGGIEGAIGKKAEEIYQQLPEEHQPQLATVLSRLVTLSPDGETITSRAARWSELSQASETSFVQAMVNSRLFVSHLQNNEPCFSLAHEALLRRWPRASEWISAHKDSLTIKSRLQQLTERWLKEDKSSAYLLPQGKPLEEALSLQTMPVFTLDSDELALLKASQQKVKAKRWLTRTTITLLCFLTFTAIFMSVKSQQSEAFAQQKRLDAESLLGFMVGEFADKLRSVGRMDLLDGISNKALEYFSQQDTSQTYTSHFQQLQTLAAIGEVAYSRGKSDEAEQGFQTARKLAYQLLQSDSIEPKLLKTAGATEFWLGQLDYDNSRWELARAHYQAYLELSEKMYTLDKEDKDSQFELASAFLTLGALAAKTRKQNHGANYFEKAIEHYSNLAKQYPNDAAISRSSAIAFSWLADAQLQLGQMELAKKNYKLELNTLSTLHQANPDNLDLIRNLANAHNRNAQIFMIDDDNKRAAEHFLSGVRLLTQATSADPANQGWQLNLRKNKLSFLSVTEVDKELEHDTLDSLTQDLLASTPSNTFERRELVRLLILSMRAALRRESAITEQLSRVESEVTILLKNSPEDISFKELRAHIWLIQAQVIQPSERKEICKKAVNFYQSVLQSTNSPSVLAYLKQAETCSFT